MICADSNLCLWMLVWRLSNKTETCCHNKILIFMYCRCVLTKILKIFVLVLEFKHNGMSSFKNMYTYVRVHIHTYVFIYAFIYWSVTKGRIYGWIYKHIPFRLFWKYRQHECLLVRTVNIGISLWFHENAEIWCRRNIKMLLYDYKLHQIKTNCFITVWHDKLHSPHINSTFRDARYKTK
jgi:hypothetical protein